MRTVLLLALVAIVNAEYVHHCSVGMGNCRRHGFFVDVTIDMNTVSQRLRDNVEEASKVQKKIQYITGIQEQLEKISHSTEPARLDSFLGVTLPCSDATVKRQYHRKALIYHPDKYKGSRVEALRLFRKLRRAYDGLRYDWQRAHYGQVGYKRDIAKNEAGERIHYFVQSVVDSLDVTDREYFEVALKFGSKENNDVAWELIALKNVLVRMKRACESQLHWIAYDRGSWKQYGYKLQHDGTITAKRCNAIPGLPEPERCNTRDEDCDGIISNPWIHKIGKVCEDEDGTKGTYQCRDDEMNVECVT